MNFSTNPSFVRRRVLATQTVAKVRVTADALVFVEDYGAPGKWRALGSVEQVLSGACS